MSGLPTPNRLQFSFWLFFAVNSAIILGFLIPIQSVPIADAPFQEPDFFPAGVADSVA